MDDVDAALLALVQDGFPVTARPFQALGKALGLDEGEVIRKLGRLQREGLVRRIGPILDLHMMGLAGVLAAIKAEPEKADEVAGVVNEYPEVSHNYLRPDESGYNLWFTISAREERIEEILSEIRARADLEVLVLPTARIFKIGVRFDII
jgi:DNA-binding Lrp family transcriptional regulator